MGTKKSQRGYTVTIDTEPSDHGVTYVVTVCASSGRTVSQREFATLRTAQAWAQHG